MATLAFVAVTNANGVAVMSYVCAVCAYLYILCRCYSCSDCIDLSSCSDCIVAATLSGSAAIGYLDIKRASLFTVCPKLKTTTFKREFNCRLSSWIVTVVTGVTPQDVTRHTTTEQSPEDVGVAEDFERLEGVQRGHRVQRRTVRQVEML